MSWGEFMTIENYYKTLPGKRMGSGALLLNEANELIIVKPTYKEGWAIPGGVVEENESPRQACLREVEEEIGLELAAIKFLCLDWQAAHSDKPETLQFIFYGGVLDDKQIKQIKLAPEELSEYQFVSVARAVQLLRKRLAQRIPKCLEALANNTVVYLEDGR